MKSEKQENFWKKWQTITGVIVTVCVLLGGAIRIVWAKGVQPEIKKEVEACQAKFENRLDRKFDLVIESIKDVGAKVTFLDTSLTPRVDKMAAVQWMTTTKTERDKASDYYKNVMGGR